MKYQTIVVDPPWAYRDKLVGLKGQGAEQQYQTLSIKNLRRIPVGDWGDTRAHLYVWTTNAFMEYAHRLARSWGFEPKTILTWVKTGGMGLGRYFRNNSEHVVFAARDRLPMLRHDLPTVFEAPKGRHSEKPGAFYDLVEQASPQPRLDVFARKHRFGWDAWGNEVFSAPGLPSPEEVSELFDLKRS